MSAKPRRIMMVAPHFEEYAYLLSLALAEHVDVLLVLDEAVLDAEFVGRDRPRHDRLTISDNRFRTARDLARLANELRRFRPDVLHWQEPSGFVKAAFAALTVTVARSFARTAITIHDPVPHVGRDSRVAARLAWLRRYARRSVDRLFLHGPACAAQYQIDYLDSLRPDPRVRLTEHGIVLAARDTARKPGRFRAAMIGRMEAYKGLETLVEALELLDREGRQVDVDIAGSGPELDRLASRLAVLPGVTISNAFIPARDLIERIVASDCLLLPYTDASQSGVLAAAFANDRFVIASAVGGIVDLVEDGVNGLLIPPQNPQAVAAAIGSVAEDALLREKLQNGARQTAAGRLNWDRIAAQLLADY